MKKIDQFNVRASDGVWMESLLDKALTLVSDGKGRSDDMQKLAEVLAFKFWHENEFIHVNSSMESKDEGYVKIHWRYFKNDMARRCPNFAVSPIVDYRRYALALGALSEWISYQHPKAVSRAVLKSVFEDKEDGRINVLVELIRSPENLMPRLRQDDSCRKALVG